MAIDRDATLKKAEKLLRQGRLEPAIAEYVRVVEENPRDWSTANTLGELYARAGQPQNAVTQYTRIAHHFVDEGFYPKAAALYKKILKIQPLDETTQIQLADISARQGLLADAKAHLNTIATRRRSKGDRRGAAEIVVKLGTIDPADFEARLAAARTLEEMGEEEEAGKRFRALHADLLDKGRNADAIDALKQFVRINPLEAGARSILAKAALDAGDVAGAREFLDEASAGQDAALLLPLAEIELRSSDLGRARSILGRLLTANPAQRSAVIELGWSFLGSNPETTFACLDSAVDAATAAGEFQEAATNLQTFVAKAPGQISALLKLVEVCVDGGLEQPMYEAQELLTDAYLAANQAAEARVIAEDLVAREPWEAAHIDRFRKALVMLRVSDPDMLIAERLSGQAPFMAHDPFFEAPEPPPPPEAPPPAEEASSEDVAPPSDAVPEPEAADGQPETREPEPAPADASYAAAQSPATLPESSSGSEEIDLTGALGGLDEPAPPPRRHEPAASGSLDQAFAKIRIDAEGDADFSAQHMTLARTYLEIGMVDEAIASLQTAVRSPRHRFEAASALGRAYQRRGDAVLAVEWLERAAEEPAPSVDDSRALLYDLGVLLDDAGETSRALAVFLELQADAGDYRDAPARIDRLARVQTGG